MNLKLLRDYIDSNWYFDLSILAMAISFFFIFEAGLGWLVGLVSLVAMGAKFYLAAKEIRKLQRLINTQLIEPPLQVTRSIYYDIGLKVTEDGSRVNIWKGIELHCGIEKQPYSRSVIVALESVRTSWNYRRLNIKNHYFHILLVRNENVKEIYRVRNRHPSLLDENVDPERLGELANELAHRLGVGIRKILSTTDYGAKPRKAPQSPHTT